MPEYEYKARNLSGQAIRGSMEAASTDALELALNERGFFSTEVRQRAQELSLGNLIEKVSKRDLAVFCRQLSVVINSGITILEAVSILSEQVEKKTFRTVLESVRDDLQKGRLLSQAMASFPAVFPEFLVNMVRIGEASGTLDTVMEQMASFYENEDKIARKVKSAMTYPSILAVMTVGVVALLMLLVLPMFSNILGQMGGKLPGITRGLMAVSTFMVNNVLTIAFVVIVLVAAFVVFVNSDNGRLRYDGFKIGHSPFKRINVRVITARFARSMGILLKSGMNILHAMNILCGLIGNKAVEARFQKSTDEVKQGRGISESLQKMGIFPPLLLHMVAVGEKTGELDQMLLRTSAFFDEEVDAAIMRMTTFIEPVLIILLASVVAVILLSIFLPMLEIMNNIS